MLTLGDCGRKIEQALGGRLDHRLSTREIVNQAGEFFMSHYPWKWARSRSTRLDFKAPIKGTAATCSTSGLVLTSGTGDFSSYTHQTDDRILITAGSSNIPTPNDGRQVEIVSKDSSTQLTLASAINNDGLAGTGIGWTIEFDYFDLPSDFGQVLAVHATDELTRGFREVTPGTLQSLRSDPVETSSWFYWGVISHRLAPGEVKPIFEIWPIPSSEELQWITLWYSAAWPRLSADNDKLTLPVYCEAYYLEILREFALGLTEREMATVDQRLAVLQRGPQARAAMRQDGGMQRNLGPIQNGAQSMVLRPDSNKFTRTPVQPPS